MEKQSPQTEQTKFGVVGLASTLLVLVILVVVLKELASFIQPLFFAIFFFYISHPIVKSLIERKIPSFVAHLVPLFLVVLILFLIGWMIGAHIDTLAAQFPGYKGRVQGLFQSSLMWVFEHLPVVGEKLREVMSGQTIPLGHLESVVKATVGNFVGFLSFGFLVLFFLIFIMQEAGSMPKRVEAAYGPRRAAQILGIGNRINKGIIRYVYVKGLASLTVAFLSMITMLAFRLDLAILWGVLTFFANFIPYVGSAAAVAFPVVIAFLQFGSLGAVLAMVLILVGIQILVGNYLEPKFAGQQLNLSPVVVLLSLAFWGWLWGIVGLILSIPIMVSLKLILENIPATREISILMSHVTKSAKSSRQP